MAATLEDVIERLKQEGQLTRNTGSNSIKGVINKLNAITPIFSSIENAIKEQTSIIAQSFGLTQEMLERQRNADQLRSVSGEPSNDATPTPPSNRSSRGDVGGAPRGDSEPTGIFSGSLLGTGLGNAFKAIMSPLKSLFKLVARNGPLAIVVGLLYSVFHDIGENENFKATVESIKNTWNNSIVPVFEKLKETINSLMGTESFSESMTTFKEKWDGFRKIFQDFVLFTVEDTFKAIGGIFEGIGLILDGEWKEGIYKIINSVLVGIQNIADNAITGILKLFGVDFGEDGSFLGWIDNRWNQLLDDIYDIWENFTTSIGQQWEATKTFLKETFDDFTRPIKNALSSAFGVITDIFSFGEEDKTALGLLGKLTDIVYAPINLAINFAKGLFGFSTEGEEPFKLQDYISEKISQAITWVKESLVGLGETLKTKFEDLSSYISSVPDRVKLFAEGMFIDVSEKLRIGFTSLGAWIASIPARIKLMALNAIRSATSGLPEWAQIVSQEDVSAAEASVNARDAELENSITQIRESAQSARDDLERRRAELDAVQNAASTGAAPTVIIQGGPVSTNIQQNTRGGSSVQQNNISGGASDLDYGLPSGVR
jgi:hypothetical protein